MLAFSVPDSALPSLAGQGWQPYDLFSLVQSLLTVLVCLPWAIVVPLWIVSSIFIVLLPRAFRWAKARFEGRETSDGRMATGVWTIHGRKYDMTTFANKHPGGAWALQLGRNRDCTGLFESYHVFADMTKLEKVLARYELPESKAIKKNQEPTDNPTGLVFRDAFHEDVKKMAQDYFIEKGASHKMKTWVFILTLLVIGAEIACVTAMLNGYRFPLVLMPILGWWLTGNVAHDASHFGLSARPWVNSVFAYSSAPMFFNSTAWYIQHIIQHHVYTNDEDDVDLYHFLPVCRCSRFSKWCPTFAMQWLSVFLALPTSVCHLSFVVPLDLLTRYIDPVTKTRRYEQCENVADLVAGVKWALIIEFVVSFSFPVAMFYCHGLLKGFVWLATTYTIASYLFIIMTQGAHLQDEAQIGKDYGSDFSWAKRQVLTAVNFSPQSRFWWLASGGLNMQGLHHILPSVSATHLRDMYPLFREVCRKHDVELKEKPGMAAFFIGFLGWVQELSKEDPLPKTLVNTNEEEDEVDVIKAKLKAKEADLSESQECECKKAI